MFGWNKKKEERATQVKVDDSLGLSAIMSYFQGGNLADEKSAMAIPTFGAAVDLITSSIAQLPIYLYRQMPDGRIIKISSDDRLKLLNDEPNYSMTANDWKKLMIKDYLLYGATYNVIERNKNTITGIYNLPINEVNVTRYRELGYKNTAKITLNSVSCDIESNFRPDQLLISCRNTKDGFIGEGVLKQHEDLICLAKNELEYSKNILLNGSLPIGVLQTASKITEKAMERLKSSWKDLYTGAKNAGKTLILEEGLEYKAMSLNPNELELVRSKENTIAELARIFNVPESMLNASANKYSSNEQNNVYFLQYCVSPILATLESSFDRSLLLESEKREGYFWRIDTSEILRATEKEKIEAIALAMKAGIISINEARTKTEMAPLKTDYFTWSLGTIFYNAETGEMLIPNLGTVIDPDKPETFYGSPANVPLGKKDDKKGVLNE